MSEQSGSTRESRQMRRRTLLRAASGTALAAGVAGCSELLGPPTVSPVWSVDIDAASAVSPPAVTGESVVVGAQDKALHAFATTDGTRQLRTETGGPIEARPAVPDGTDSESPTVHTHSTDGDLYGVDLEDGISWHVEGDEVDAPLVRAGSVVVHRTRASSDDDHVATAYRAADGQQVWRHPVESYRLDGVLAARTVLPVAVEDRDRYRYVALDNETGTVEWERERPTRGLTADADLLVGTYSGESRTELTAYAPADGSRRWQTRVEGEIQYSGSPVLDSQLFLATEQDETGQVVAIERETGEVAGRADIPPYIRAKAVSGDTLYVGTHVERDEETRLEIVAVDSAGTRQWATTLDESDADRLAVTEPVVIVNTGRALWALDTADGSRRWRYEADDSSTLGMATTSDAVVVSHRDSGRVVRLPLTG